MNEKSYTELMKKGAMKRKKRKETYVLELYIDMLLAEIIMNVEKEDLLRKIDTAIDEGNRAAFQHLSHQYRDLMQRFGT